MRLRLLYAAVALTITGAAAAPALALTPSTIPRVQVHRIYYSGHAATCYDPAPIDTSRPAGWVLVIRAADNSIRVAVHLTHAVPLVAYDVTLRCQADLDAGVGTDERGRAWSFSTFNPNPHLATGSVCLAQQHLPYVGPSSLEFDFDGTHPGGDGYLATEPFAIWPPTC
jgi:hypothetical protein